MRTAIIPEKKLSWWMNTGAEYVAQYAAIQCLFARCLHKYPEPNILSPWGVAPIQEIFGVNAPI
ncbi:MAG TPA: hypothetical protein VIJ43_01995 [Burkholderiales bacterium]